MKIIKDILKEKTGSQFKFSQGRVYLFIAFLSYIILLSFLTFKTAQCNSNVSLEAFESIISALQWIIALLAGYVFGGKGLEILKVIYDKKPNKKQ